jgi:hypothetical protein
LFENLLIKTSSIQLEVVFGILLMKYLVKVSDVLAGSNEEIFDYY